MRGLRPMIARRALLGVVGVALLAFPAHTLDLTGFVSQATPDATWGRGYGGAIGARFFGILTVEGEAAWQGSDRADFTMTTFTAAALVSPPIGPVTPYGGLCVGSFRQTSRFDSDYGTLRGFVVGLRASVLSSLV